MEDEEQELDLRNDWEAMLVSHSERVKKEDDHWVSALSNWINGSSLTAAGNMRAGLVHGEMMSSVGCLC